MQNKNILIGISGGIAAYKIPNFIRLLRQSGASARVIMTDNAKQFVTPLTLQTLTGHTVYNELFSINLQLNCEHIALARWADALLIAPATANVIAKLAHGIADDLLTATCLATTAPIAIAPAMNKEMWHAKITQENIVVLRNRGIKIFEPAAGELACGEIGDGRMLEPEQLITLLPTLFVSQLLFGKKIVITAGPTREAIDPVRYISNPSSGKMGYALAQAAQDAGANVILISGPTNLPTPLKVVCVNVTSAREMYDAVMSHIDNCDVFIGAAAVANYRSKNPSAQKSKNSAGGYALELQRNHDIIAAVAALPNKPFTIGFAAETENLLENAYNKLKIKNLDVIVANEIKAGVGFNSDENAVTILSKNHSPITLPLMTKVKLAGMLIEKFAKMQTEIEKEE